MSNGLYYLFAYDTEISGKKKKKWAGTKPPSITKGIQQGCAKLAQKLENDDNDPMEDGHKRRIPNDFFVFYCLKENGIIAICCAGKEAKLRTCYGCLEDTLDDEDFKLDRSFLKKKLKYYNNPESDQLDQCRTKIEEVKKVMIRNFDKIFANLESLEDLEQDADDLSKNALKLERTSKKLENAMLIRCGVALCIVIQIICGIISIILVVLVIMAVSAGTLAFTAALSGGGVSIDKKDGPTLLNKCSDVGELICQK